MANFKTQGTEVFVVDKETNEVLEPGCVTAVSGASASRSQISVTCLSETQSQKYTSGLADPGTGSFTVLLDPTSEVHQQLHDYYLSGKSLTFVYGFSGSTEKPTVATGEITYPAGRAFVSYDGYINDFPVGFDLDTVVSVEVSVQLSSLPEVIYTAS